MLVAQSAPSEPKKSPYHTIEVDHKVEIDFVPFMKVNKVGLEEFKAQKLDLSSYGAILFTSRITAQNFFDLCQKSGLEIPENMKYLCSTELLSNCVKGHVKVSKRRLLSSDGTFGSLMEQVLKHRKERFLLALSEPHGTDIPSVMEWMGVEYGKAILARVESTNLSKVDMERYGLLVLYTPSDVLSVTTQFEVEQLPPVVAFGRGTTAAAIAAGLKVAAIAPTPQAPSMARAVELLIEQIKRGEVPEPIEFVEQNEVELFKQNHPEAAAKK